MLTQSSFIQPEHSTSLSARVIQLALAIIMASSFAFVTLLLLLMVRAEGVQAAPPVRPLVAIFSNTEVITHTDSTTHEMRVFADGRITDQFLTDNDEDQIGTSNISATTIAIMFDQHASTGNEVDVGSQLEFSATIPITLNTVSNIPGFNEDSHVVYASRVLSYQITQRTLAAYTHNCVVMELVIENTSDNEMLTGGKLLYMVDIQAAQALNDDEGTFDSGRQLVYHTDHRDGVGYAMGLSLLEGTYKGYGIVTDNESQYPDPSDDAKIKNELMTPTNEVIDDDKNHNLVSWLVADMPDLDPGQETILAFGLCARSIRGEDEKKAEEAMLDDFDELVKLSVAKTAIPYAQSTIIADEPLTYSITLTNDGYYCNTAKVGR